MDDLIQQAKRDRTALNKLVSDNYARVYRFCVRRLGWPAGEDAAQETFIAMQRSLHNYQGKSQFTTWLLGIANNQCLNASKKKGLDQIPIENWIETQPQSQSQSQDHSQQLADRQALNHALQKLSPEHREVVLLHEVEELTYSEIAELLQIPDGTVKSRLHHAFQNLRKSMSEFNHGDQS